MLALLALSEVGHAESEATEAIPQIDQRYTIEVVTVDPGRALFSRWGHICIVVVDHETDRRIVYNYGTFGFDDPALLFRYAKGYLHFWLSVMPYYPMIEYYKWEQRGIISHTLDLTDAQAKEVFKRLRINALPENRTYAYRHYLDNCCTRIRELLNDVLDDALQEQFHKNSSTDRTYRYYTRRALTGLPVMRNIILFIMGREIDRPVTRYDEQFLPEVFGEDLDKTMIHGKPLVKKREVIFEPEGPKVGEASATWEYIVSVVVLLSLFLGLGLPLVFRDRKWAPRVAGFGLHAWGMMAGIGGLLLVIFWTATLHYDCHKNENILVFPLLHLLLVIPGLRVLFNRPMSFRIHRFLQKYLIAATVLLGVNLLLKLGPFFQMNYQFIGFAALMNLASLGVLRYVIVPQPAKRPKQSVSQKETDSKPTRQSSPRRGKKKKR